MRGRRSPATRRPARAPRAAGMRVRIRSRAAPPGAFAGPVAVPRSSPHARADLPRLAALPRLPSRVDPGHRDCWRRWPENGRHDARSRARFLRGLREASRVLARRRDRVASAAAGAPAMGSHRPHPVGYARLPVVSHHPPWWRSARALAKDPDTRLHYRPAGSSAELSAERSDAWGRACRHASQPRPGRWSA